MADDTPHTISELAGAAGVTPRTIRYYTAEGLLPPPDTRGRYALYGEEHLLRLRLIAYLKDAYLPLGEIKTRLEGLDSTQMRRLLAEYNQPTQQDQEHSASAYIAGLLGRQAPQPSRLQETLASYTPQAMSSHAPGAPFQLAAPSAPPAPAPATAHNSLINKPAPRRLAGGAQEGDNLLVQEERWQRIVLAPGAELHLREPLTPELRERIDRLIDQARELFMNPES